MIFVCPASFQYLSDHKFLSFCLLEEAEEEYGPAHR
jgi:hypothetical protein